MFCQISVLLLTDNSNSSTLKLMANVVFYDIDDNEIGKVSWIFVWDNEGIVKNRGEKARYYALESGQYLDKVQMQ